MLADEEVLVLMSFTRMFLNKPTSGSRPDLNVSKFSTANLCGRA